MSNKVCKVEGCECLGNKDPKTGARYLQKGYCPKHYSKFKKYGDPLGKAPKKPKTTCNVENCTEQMHAKGYCNKHYYNLVAHGDPLYERKFKTKHILYETYMNMRQRCYNKNSTAYSYYGGRGITVCDRWLGKNGLWNFVEDMGERPDGMTLDREDNDLGYTPENCRWATKTEQSINKRVHKNNTSGHTGVYLTRDKKKWRAFISIDKKSTLLGRFDTKEEAIQARKDAELKYY